MRSNQGWPARKWLISEPSDRVSGRCIPVALSMRFPCQCLVSSLNSEVDYVQIRQKSAFSSRERNLTCAKLFSFGSLRTCLRFFFAFLTLPVCNSSVAIAAESSVVSLGRRSLLDASLTPWSIPKEMNPADVAVAISAEMIHGSYRIKREVRNARCALSGSPK